MLRFLTYVFGKEMVSNLENLSLGFEFLETLKKKLLGETEKWSCVG